MKKITYISSIVALFFASMALNAQNTPALPFTAADYNPVTLAKGGAGLVETSSIAFAAYTNAAAIPFSESTGDVAVGYTMWQPSAVNTNYVNVAAGFNIKDKVGVAAGFSYGMFNKNDFAGMDVVPNDMQVNVGISWRFLKFLSLGANVGYARETLMKDYSLGAVTADVYLMSEFADFKIAAGVSNVGSKVKSKYSTYSLPSAVNVGLGYDKVFAEKHGVDVAVDADYYFAGAFAASVGAGYTFNDLVSVRAGYNYGGKAVIPSYASVGAGVKFFGVKIDLAYLIGVADSPMKNTLAVSLGYSF